MRWFGSWAAALLCLLVVSVAEAQTPPASVDATLAPLTDAQAREMLREKLAAEAARAEAPRADMFGGLLLRLREAGQALRDRKDMIGQSLAEAPLRLGMAFDKLTEAEGWPAVGRGLLIFLGSVAAGLLAEFGLARLLGREPKEDAATTGYAAKLVRAGHYFLVGTVHLLTFAAVTYGVSFIFLSRMEPLRELVVALALIVVAGRVFALITDTLLAPSSPERRVGDTGDGDARFLKRGLVAIATALTAIALLQGLLGLIEVPAMLLALFQVACGALVAIGTILALTVRGVARRLSGLKAARRLLFATVIAIGWIVWAIDTLVGWSGAAAMLVLALMLLISLPLLEATLRGILTGVDELRGPVGATPEAKARQQRFDDAILVVLRILVGLGAAALVAQAGGLGAGMFETGLGRRILDGAVSIATTVLIAAILWEAISIAIDRKLGARFAGSAAAPAERDPEDEMATVASRAETLLPLIRSFLWFAMIAIVGMIGLSSVGVNIGPLLAGAGVVGLAIGFGAQTLVRDIVSGIFFLIDDAFRVGEYIEFGQIRGEVERISVRSLTLRHHRGAIHVVPFGELKIVSNYNRDWAIFKMEFSLPYNTDVEKVRKIIKNIGQDLMNDPEHGRKFIEPLKSQGVVAFADSAIVIRIKFKSKPREQFVLRRIVSQRIKAAFDENGITFAYPRVVVEGGSTPEVAAAAARAVAADAAKPAA